MSTNNTRKFSDKIALLQQQQVDSNRAFNSIINEVKDVHKDKSHDSGPMCCESNNTVPFKPARPEFALNNVSFKIYIDTYPKIPTV
jgi:hypothetical protein